MAKNVYSLLLTVPGEGTKHYAQAYSNLAEARKAANHKTKCMGASCVIEIVDLSCVLQSTHAIGRCSWKREVKNRTR